jgi:hypothetical protein
VLDLNLAFAHAHFFGSWQKFERSNGIDGLSVQSEWQASEAPEGNPT